MKKLSLLLLPAVCYNLSFAQNTFPSSGIVGIGMTKNSLNKMEAKLSTLEKQFNL